VITLGTFDGVHLGHQFVLKETVKMAEKFSTEAVVLTYPRHPIEVLGRGQLSVVSGQLSVDNGTENGQQTTENRQQTTDNRKQLSAYLLTEKSKREELIQKAGIKTIHYLDFDEKMAQKTADDFLKNIIMKDLNPQMIVVGYDTHFGVNRCGDAEFLRSKASEYKYEVLELSPFFIADKVVSSSLIRDLLTKGLVDEAARHLGYHYSVVSEVVYGKQIGRTLGYPTINQDPIERYKMIPGAGVYFTVTRFIRDNSLYFGATKVGVSPTIKTENVSEIETNLFDFSDNVYGQTVETFFVEKIRDEKKFGSVDGLVEQIRIDTETIREKIVVCRDQLSVVSGQWSVDDGTDNRQPKTDKGLI
jgi:riboflavin kinase/FMN adenylyltransferase